MEQRYTASEYRIGEKMHLPVPPAEGNISIKCTAANPVSNKSSTVAVKCKASNLTKASEEQGYFPVTSRTSEFMHKR